VSDSARPSDRNNKAQGEFMLKKIALGGIFALSIAFLTTGPASAHATTRSAHGLTKKAPVPSVPHGLCPPGMPC
jgi:hypothetical protein